MDKLSGNIGSMAQSLGRAQEIYGKERATVEQMTVVDGDQPQLRTILSCSTKGWRQWNGKMETYHDGNPRYAGGSIYRNKSYVHLLSITYCMLGENKILLIVAFQKRSATFRPTFAMQPQCFLQYLCRISDKIQRDHYDGAPISICINGAWEKIRPFQLNLQTPRKLQYWAGLQSTPHRCDAWRWYIIVGKFHENCQ